MDELLSAIRETQVLQTSTQVTRNAPDQDYLTWNWDLISLILEVCSVIGKRKNIICCAFFLCNVLLQMMSLLVVYHFIKSINCFAKVFELLLIKGLVEEWFAE